MKQVNIQTPTIKDYTKLLNEQGKVVQMIEIYQNAGLEVLVRRYEAKRVKLQKELEQMKNSMLFASSLNARA